VTTTSTSGDADDDLHFGRRLQLVVAVGAITRIAIWVAKWNRQLSLNDSFYYSVQATELGHGHLYVEPFTSFHGAEHPPLTSTLMAALSWWSNDPVRWQRLVTVAAGIATIACIGLLGRAVAGARVGLVSAGLAVVYPNLWMNDGLVMSESISVLAVSIALLALWRAMEAPSVRRWIWCGVATGLAMLARSELVLLVPIGAVLLVLAARRRRAAGADGGAARGSRRGGLAVGILVVAALATTAPWVVFNLVRFERPVFLTTNDGTTLAGAYCPQAFGGPGLGGWSILCLSDDDQLLEPSIRSERRRHDALEFLRSHEGELPKVVAARVLRTVDLYGLHDLVFQDVGEERWRWASWAGIVSFWVLAPTAVFGLTRLRRRARWTLLGPVLAVLVTTVVFYGAHRIRSSAEPTVVIGAAVAIVTFVDRRRARPAKLPVPGPVHRAVDAP
jgi:4-amino-4-deoxy-L-arabinose transferase-like glycosyltransferase